MKKLGYFIGVCSLLLGMAVSQAKAYQFAVWLDGETSPGGGGNPILTEIDQYFGTNNYTLVSTADLETPGFLNSFDCVVVSRYGSDFGTALSTAAASNIMTYVGAPGHSQGGVALYSNDIADNLYGTETGDPYDPLLDALFRNGLRYAAATHHGYVGEFNGAVMGVTANTVEWPAMGFLQGQADALHGYGPEFVYGAGPIGADNPIDAGVTFPFTDSDDTTFLTDITGANPSNIVDVYVVEDEGVARTAQDSINGEPAVMANAVVISGGGGETGTCSSVEGLLSSAEGLGLTTSQRARLARQLTIIGNSIKRKYPYGACQECVVMGQYLNALVRLGQLNAEAASSVESCCTSLTSSSCVPKGDQPGNGGGNNNDN
jgi:hypothetical protein